MKIYFKKGFSLIEALVTIAVIGALGLGLSTLVTRTYKGSAKTELIGNVKQNAQSTLDKITQIIRNADSVVCHASPGSTVPYETLVVRSQNGNITRIFIVPPKTQNNGYVAKQDFAQAPDSNANYCVYNSQFPENSPAPDILTDNLKTSGVSVKSGTFMISTKQGSKDTVTVQLKIGPNVNSATSFEQGFGDNTNNYLTFTTSVQLR